MLMNPNLTSLEVLGIAIKAEIDAIAVYRRLIRETKNRTFKAKLRFLVGEEKKHRQLLEELYAQKFPETELKVPTDSLLPKIATTLNGKPSVGELLELAMQAEGVAEEFYSTQAKASKDMAARTMLEYLSGMERGHYHLLKSEYDLLQQFPDYYKVEDFHLGEELIHIGP